MSPCLDCANATANNDHKYARAPLLSPYLPVLRTLLRVPPSDTSSASSAPRERFDCATGSSTPAGEAVMEAGGWAVLWRGDAAGANDGAGAGLTGAPTAAWPGPASAREGTALVLGARDTGCCIV